MKTAIEKSLKKIKVRAKVPTKTAIIREKKASKGRTTRFLARGGERF